MQPSLMWGRVLAGFIGLYHLIVGVVLIVSGELSIRLAKALGGMTIEGSPALGIAGEVLGCYLIAFGLMMLAAARDPVGRRDLLTIGVVLIALRVVQRIWFGAKMMEVFQVPAFRHWIALLIVLGMGVALTLFRAQVGRHAATSRGRQA